VKMLKYTVGRCVTERLEAEVARSDTVDLFLEVFFCGEVSRVDLVNDTTPTTTALTRGVAKPLDIPLLLHAIVEDLKPGRGLHGEVVPAFAQGAEYFLDDLLLLTHLSIWRGNPVPLGRGGIASWFVIDVLRVGGMFLPSQDLPPDRWKVKHVEHL